ncbi:MAG: FeoB-associated Cys-rich membrane protein [Prevotella sp.]|nr:FeoB-associated Cys-rich membrane protein [Prevotella sp.]MDY4038790.1 FeoB-associated Cys-rich membrane protein [Prevotella sp.]
MIQTIIVIAVVTGCVAYAGRHIYKEIKRNSQCENYGCAGCAFYEKCKRNKKIN